MDRPRHLMSSSAKVNVKTKGIPSNSQDVIQAHAHAIEAYVHDHIGANHETEKWVKCILTEPLRTGLAIKLTTEQSLTLRLALDSVF